MQSDAINTTERERERENKISEFNDAMMQSATGAWSWRRHVNWQLHGFPISQRFFPSNRMQYGRALEDLLPHWCEWDFSKSRRSHTWQIEHRDLVYLCINISLELTVNWLTSPFHNFLCSCCLGVFTCLGLQLNLAGSKTKHLCGCFLVLQIACWPMQVWRQV